jgi:hypothetical protein
MSWETFKQNILRVANNPDGILNVETIADLYANEYDAAIKSGFDTANGTTVRNGDIASMKQLFLSALQKGLTSTQPYDLVGEMGEGVLAYWRTAILGNEKVPVTPAIGATSNISVTENRVTVAGVWQKPVAQIIQSFELKPEERIAYQEKLEIATTKYETAIEEQKPIEASTHLDEINKFQSILIENETYRIDVPAPTTNPNPSPVQKAETTNVVPSTTTPSNITQTTTQTSVDEEYYEEEEFSTRINSEEDVVIKTQFNEGKPFNVGFRGGGGLGGFGGGGGTGYNIPYVPFPSGFPANATLGQKAVTLALYDANLPVKENPVESDTGHERILQMQKIGAGGGTGFPWCACAVTTWWKEAGVDIPKGEYPLHPNYAYVPTWVKWAIANNRFVDKRNGANPDYIPKTGDAIIYGWGSLNNDHGGFDHIGLVWKIENGTVYGVDGNYSAGVTTHVANPKTIRGYVLI